MLIIRRFSHRHSRSFFIPNYKQRENPLNECEKTFVEKVNPLRNNPLNECEKSFYSALYKKNVNPVIDNPLNECENTRE
jgi:hypothetical protein